MWVSKNESNSVGIIGGGQLAWMLALAAFRMGLRPLVLAESSEAPAAQIVPQAIFGKPQDPVALRCFMSQVRLITIENEFLDCPLLRKFSSDFNIEFHPRLDVLEILQDKVKQKQLLEKLEIPSARWEILDSNQSLDSQIPPILDHFGNSCVLKWSRWGYDGKGVLVLEKNKDSLSKVEEFCSEAKKRKSLVFVEEKIQFKRELALIAVRSKRDEFASYPLVISEQKNGICNRVYGPATSFGVDSRKQKLAQEYAHRIANDLGFTGTFGIEFFENEKSEILVNEIAPRVHNSGHYTQNACSTDQFENHWRAILGLPLGRVDSKAGFAMQNYLGVEGFTFQSDQLTSLPISGPRTHLHWYGKKVLSPQRKLGHMNGAVEDLNEMYQLIDELNGSYQTWIKHIHERFL